MKRYTVRIRVTSEYIDEADTFQEARRLLIKNVVEDKNLGIYTPKFYEVYDNESEEVVFTFG